MITESIIDYINVKLNEIIHYENNDWLNLTLNEKCKIIHHCTANLHKNNKELEIPLKSLKPKKIILLCGFNKKTLAYKKYWQTMLNYTRIFRETINTDIYKRFQHLSNYEYNKILNDINTIIYEIIKNNMNEVKPIFFYNNLLGNNIDKIINNKSNDTQFKIEKDNNILNLNFNNLKIILTLEFSKDIIGKEIPIIYKIKAKSLL